MHALTKEQITKIIEVKEGPCVSIYMPQHRAPVDNQQNTVMFENLLRKAEDTLTSRYLYKRHEKDWLEPARNILSSRSFWQHPGSNGLAMFISPQFFQYFHLPCATKEFVAVTSCFQLKPLLALYSSCQKFYLLALGMNSVSLFQSTPYDLIEVPLPGAPYSLAKTLRYDDPEKVLGLHSGHPGQQSAIFHGQAIGIDDEKENIMRYCHEVNSAVKEALHNEHAPLVLAGVDYLTAMYKKINKYRYLISESIEGSPSRALEGKAAQELQTRALDLVQPYLGKKEKDTAARFQELIGTNQTSTNILKVLPRSMQGQVDSIFVDLDAHAWGTLKQEQGKISSHAYYKPGDQDLLDLAASQTFLHGGNVFVTESSRMPVSAAVAAIFRY